MYTFHPIVNLANSRMGFYIVVVSVIIVLLLIQLAKWGDQDDKDMFFHIVLTISAFLVALTSHQSWADKPPKNEQVIATKVKETENIATSTGKDKSTFPVMHVIYKTPDGEVSFRKRDGAIYPDKAILYKN